MQTDPQDFPLMLVKYMRREAAMRPQGLSSKGAAETVITLSEIADVISLGTHHDISVGLLEA